MNTPAKVRRRRNRVHPVVTVNFAKRVAAIINQLPNNVEIFYLQTRVNEKFALFFYQLTISEKIHLSRVLNQIPTYKEGQPFLQTVGKIRQCTYVELQRHIRLHHVATFLAIAFGCEDCPNDAELR